MELMMTKKKPKKPTLNQVKQVAENLIHDLRIVNNKVDSLAMILNGYVEYKKDEKKFISYLKKQKEKIDAKQRTTDKGSR